MSDAPRQPYVNVFHNEAVGATPNPVMPSPDALDEAFAAAANEVLDIAVVLIRELIGAHQSAAAIVVQQDWNTVRKYFSLSEKYAAWADYRTSAVGYGIHAWLLEHNQPVRFTQDELEQHPEWKGSGSEAGTHPPMRGWLAAPLVDSSGANWGLLQLSDKDEGDFTAEDEWRFVQFARLVSLSLEALWEVRTWRKAAAT